MKISWSTTALLTLVFVLLFSAYAFGPMLGVPPALHAKFVGGVAAFCAPLLAVAAPMFARALGDDDGDGVPNFADRKTPEPSESEVTK